YQESSKEEEGLGDQVDASKQERIAEIDADDDLSLIYDTSQDQGRMNNEDLFRINDLDGDEVIVDVTASENLERDATVAEKEVSATADEIVTTAESVKARGVIVQEPTEFRTTSFSQPSQLPHAKDKEVARKLDTQMKAEMAEEEMIAKEKDEANRDSVNTFVAMDSEVIERSKKTQAKVIEGSYKRAGDEIEQESAKRKRLEKKDDIAELKRCLEIVPEDDDDVTIEATPLSSKSPTIVDYKIYKEGKKSYIKIIRADGNSQKYLTFGTMFKNFNREDLKVLRSINMMYYLMVENMCPFTNNILHQLRKDVRLRKFLASDEFSRVQGELLSLAASVGFENRLVMHQTKDEFVDVLKKMAHFMPGAQSRLVEASLLVAQTNYAFLNKIFEFTAEPLSVILQLEPEKLVRPTNVPTSKDAYVSHHITKESTVTPASESLELSDNVVLLSLSLLQIKVRSG
nr:hypothetical protein [Tanacetum cinerariifolium]GEZ11462.1 hypothetical protein [Tanacetum cinerariifolium]